MKGNELIMRETLWNPMSAEQERMWYMYNLNPDTSYNLQFYIALRGEVDLGIIYKTIRTIINCHDTLRMKVNYKNDNLGCSVFEDMEPDIKMINLSGTYLEKEIEVTSIAQQDMKKVFDLINEFPLRMSILRYDEENYKVIFTTHHIYFDGWSVGVFINEFKKYYLQFEKNENTKTERLNCQFGDFVSYQNKHDHSKDKEYWEKYLNKSEKVLNLPYSYFAKTEDTHDGNSISIYCSENLKVLDLCRENQITSSSFFLSIYFVTLMICCKQDDITIGIPYINRNTTEFQKIIGYFANTIPIQESINDNLTFVDLTKKICEDTINGIIHGEIPFNQVVDLFRDSHVTNKNPIYQTMFSMRNDTLTSSSSTKFSQISENVQICSGIINDSDKVEFDLICTVNERVDDYKITFGYNTSLFSNDRIVKLSNIYKTLMNSFLCNTNVKIFDLAKQHTVEFQEEYLDEAIGLQNKLLEQEPNILDVNIKLLNGCAVVFYVAEQDIKNNIISILSDEILDTIIPIHQYKLAKDDILHEMAEDVANRSYDIKKILSQKVNVRNMKFYARNPEVSSRTYSSSELVSNVLKKSALEDKKKFECNDLSLLDGGDLQHTEFKILSDILYSLSEEEKQREILTIQFGDVRKYFTYGELFNSAKIVAGNLQALGIKVGDIIILQINNLEDCLKFYWGATFMGAIVSIVAVPQNQDYTANNAASVKVKNILQITEQTYVIAGENEAESMLKSGIHEHPERIFTTSSLLKSNENIFEKPQLSENDVSLMLFTSGSTGLPKGVTLSHRNIILRTVGAVQRFGLNELDTALNWMPLEHVGGIIMFHMSDMFTRNKPIYVETSEILRKPASWLYLMSEYKVTQTWAPNFSFSLLMKYKQEILDSDIDLSNIKYIFNGGEAINFESCDKWLNIMSHKGLKYSSMVPAWGMTETTSGVLFSQKFGEILYKNTVGTGSPDPGVKARIVSPDLEILPCGTEGLLQMAGETINQGYYNNPTENKKAFTRDNWFDTGDLGIITQGEVVITGRAKEILIINGVNISCQEIEKNLEKIDGLTSGSVACSSVRMDNSDTDEFIVFYGEADLTIRDEMKSKISECLIQSLGFNCQYLVPVDENSIPRSAIGKIDKKRLVKQFLNGELRSIIERNQIPNWFYKEEIVESHLTNKVKTLNNQIIVSLLDDAISEDATINASNMCSKIINILETKLSGRKENSLIVLNQKSNIGTSSLLEGFLAAVPYEYTNLKIRLIELQDEVYPSDELLQDEFASIEKSVENFSIVYYEKDYKNRKQSVITLEDMRNVPIIKSPIVSGGTYILFGGLGGIGKILTKYLLKQYNCNVIAIGKTDIENSPERRLQVEHFKRIGNFSFKQINLENSSVVQDVLEECGESIDGIFYMIGETPSELRRKNMKDFQIKNYSKDSLQKVFEFRCNMIDEIYKFASNKKNLDVIVFSSITSLFGGSLYSAYSATSRYLCEIGKTYPSVSYHSIAWSKWKDTGMSAGESANEGFAAENAGYHMIEESNGIISLEAILSRDCKQVLVGINPDKNLLHSHRYFKDENPLMIFAQISESDSEKLKECNKLMDKVQPAHVETYLTDIYDVVHGYNDKEIESKVVSVLSKILDISDLSIKDNFFDIGGNSLNSIRVAEELSKACECEFSVVDIYSVSTINEIILCIQSRCNIEERVYDTSIEEKLITLLSKILEVNSISGKDNFFDIGGNSLNSIRVSEEISREFQCDFSVVDIYNCSTIHELALNIMQKVQTVSSKSSLSRDVDEDIIIDI
ncbi:condensation domain-containing protein [Clostridium sp. MF28]|nr:condensation domain-containing protein [Clostridium sp. MF28]PSM55313.1 hypothetical protein C4L39_23545 [Clostridium diolis]